MSVFGSVRHIRPLPSDSTTDSVPGLGDREVRARNGDLRAQERPAQVPAGRHRQLARLVGQVRRQLGAEARHLAAEDLADLAAVAVDRRDQDVRRAGRGRAAR
jgi:hypothetical protein